jgi:hypothetical protein
LFAQIGGETPMEYTCNELLVERVTLLRSINDHLKTVTNGLHDKEKKLLNVK